MSLQRIRTLLKTLDFDWASEKPLILFGILAMFLEVIARLLEPWPLKFIFDYAIDPSRSGFSYFLSYASTNPTNFILICSLMVVIVAAIRGGAEYTSTISFAIVGNRFLTRLRSRTFDHIQALSLRFHDQAKTGDLVARLVGDMGRLQDVGVTAILPMAVHTITLFVMLVVMFFMNIRLAFLAVFAFPLFYLFVVRSGRNIRSVARNQRKREGALGAASAEAFSAIRTVQAMGLEHVMSSTFGSKNLKSASQAVMGKRLAARLERGVDILIALFTAVILWQGSVLTLNKQLTPGDLLVFLAYLKNAFKPMRDMAKYSTRIASSIASAERITQILELEPELVVDEGQYSAPKQVKSINFSDVTFAYEPSKPILKNLSINISQSQLIALYGPSGSGKTTMINLLLRLYDPDSGKILYNQQDIRSFDLKSLRKSISVVPQESLLFNMSVRDNILIGMNSISDDDIYNACEVAGASDIIDSMPQGLDTIISERGTNLSGGQQRRLAIARAAVRNTPILIMDEPFAGLDARNAEIVSKAIQNLKANRIVFCIFHDIKAAAIADRVIFIRQGNIVLDKSPEDISSINLNLSELYLA